MAFSNVKNYLQRAIESIKIQKIKNWTCHLIDDASTDGSSDVAISLLDNRFHYIRNNSKHYQVRNYNKIIQSLEDNDICVAVDGDDYLPDSGVFNRLNDIYKYDIWITWGSNLCCSSQGSHITQQMPLEDIYNLRRHPWVPFHLRTWKVFLWRKIKEEDLKDEEGNWWTVAGDLAFMYPMIEMAGKEHSRFLPEINYIYNHDNPDSNHFSNRELQKLNDQKIRNKQPYIMTKIHL